MVQPRAPVRRAIRPTARQSPPGQHEQPGGRGQRQRARRDVIHRLELVVDRLELLGVPHGEVPGLRDLLLRGGEGRKARLHEGVELTLREARFGRQPGQCHVHELRAAAARDLRLVEVAAGVLAEGQELEAVENALAVGRSGEHRVRNGEGDEDHADRDREEGGGPAHVDTLRALGSPQRAFGRQSTRVPTSHPLRA